MTAINRGSGMSKQTLFGHLASRFASHPENLATEALRFIVNTSPTAKLSFLQFLNAFGFRFAESALIRTQQMMGEDQAIPDLVGLGDDLQPLFIVEAKFWAGLTDKQPCAYLKCLNASTESLLLFVAPSARMTLLQRELLQRCDAEAGEFRDMKNERWCMPVGRQILAITSWRSLLNFLLEAAQGEGDREAYSNLHQLIGLCESMDSSEFLPLRSEELTGQTAARMLQYCDIVDEVTDRAVAAGIASVERRWLTSGSGYYGRYLRLYNVGCSIKMSAQYWSKRYSTPLWLTVQGPGFKNSIACRKALLPLEYENRLFYGDSNEMLIPLNLIKSHEHEAEHEQVVQYVFSQVERVADLLKDIEASEAVAETENPCLSDVIDGVPQ